MLIEFLQENGVDNAIKAIYTWLPRAKRDRQTLD